MAEITKLTTETQNEATKNIDLLSTREMVKLINDEDKKVAPAIEKELDNVAKAIDMITENFKKGGRIIYTGAGTSGRLGVMDSSELLPTYGLAPERAFGVMAGGQGAMFKAVEGAEDSKELGLKDMKEINLGPLDSVIGVAASGRTPYTIATLEYANSLGCVTVAVTCNADSEMAKVAKVSIAPVVGPEVISGSTRMKAGTSQKMVLNMISTGVMVKTGKVYGNLMVNVQPTNEKLVKRSINMIKKINEVSDEEAERLFNESGQSVAIATIMHKTGVTKDQAEKAFAEHDGMIRPTIDALNA